MAMYLITVTLVRYGPPGFHELFDRGFFKPSGTLLGACGVGVFFFLTNFFNRSLDRYYALYDHTVAMDGRIYDIMQYIQAYTVDGNPTHRHIMHQTWRYMNAAHIFSYSPLEEKLTLPLIDELRLLTVEERNFFFDKRTGRLVVSANHAMRTCLKWCTTALRYVMREEGLKGFSSVDAKFFDALLVDFRIRSTEFWAMHDLPVPIDYIQVMLISMTIYCGLIGYTVALELSELGNVTMYLTGPVLIFCFCTQLAGLFYLSKVLEFPFGDDQSDLPFLAYIVNAALGSYALYLEDSCPDFPTASTDEFARETERAHTAPGVQRPMRRSMSLGRNREKFYADSESASNM
jgi:hypothetical protein